MGGAAPPPPPPPPAWAETPHPPPACPADQQQRVDAPRQHREARLGHGVVRGLVVRLEQDLAAEWRRYLAAMAKHMPDVAARQPQARQQRASEQNQENLGKER